MTLETLKSEHHSWVQQERPKLQVLADRGEGRRELGVQGGSGRSALPDSLPQLSDSAVWRSRSSEHALRRSLQLRRITLLAYAVER